MSSFTASLGWPRGRRCRAWPGRGLRHRGAWVTVGWALFLLCLPVRTVLLWGAEPAEAFLRELKARGYHELALEYLDRLEASGVVEDEFRRTIDFQQGEVLIQAALQQRTLSRKQTALDRAQQEFDQFTREHPEHALAVTAQGRLGEIVMERARLLVSQANQPTTAPERGAELRGQARQLFDDAATIFVQHKAQLRSRLEEIPKALSPSKDPALIKERDLLRGEYVQAQFVAALVHYEQALTFEAESESRVRRLQQAEEAFKGVAEKYRRRVAGLSAVLFQGRCRQLSQDPRGALSFFEDLLTLPDGEAVLRPLKTKALRGAMECWLTPEIAQYEAARQRAESWLQQERGSERAEDDWLMVKLLLAETYQQLAAAGSGREKGELTRESRRLAHEVAKYRGEAQERAQHLLAQLGHVTQPVAQTQKVTSFDEAMTAAQEALSQRQIAAQTVELLQGRLLGATDEANREEIQQRLAESRTQLTQAEATALDLLKQGQDLITDETPLEQVNQARYYLCTLYYYREDYYAAVVMADFLASRFPASDEGRRAAAVSLASLVRLYGDGSSTWSASMYQRMTQTAERIARQWKGQPEADDALATLVTIAVQQGNTKAALAYLEQMSPESPRRAAAELAAGQALWRLANQGIQDDGDAGSPEQRQAEAVELMRRGLQRSAGQEPNSATLSAALIVAQHLVNQGQAAEAVELLDGQPHGPKTLADQNHPLLQDGDLRQRVYLLSIMAYLGGLSAEAASEELIDKALETLGQVSTMAQEDPARRRQLSSTYVLLARNLQQQIESAPVGRQTRLIEAFALLLDRAAATTRELSVLSWVAESCVNLGQAVEAVRPNDTAAAAPYFAKAVSTYKQLLKRSDAGEFTMTVKERLLLETRLAIALRAAGELAEAVDRFAIILQREPNQVYVQMEAARTLQAWGNQGNHAAYQLAILGDRLDDKTKRNTIWGYGRIGKLTAGKASLNALFYEARFGVAECRYQYALQLAATQRMETLQLAEQDVVMTARLYPTLGGEASKEKFNRLLQQIQQSMGKRPTGLSR